MLAEAMRKVDRIRAFRQAEFDQKRSQIREDLLKKEQEDEARKAEEERKA